MGFRRLVQGTTLAALVAMAARVSIDGDTFWHLAAGRWMLQHGHILRTDPFSITRAGQAWVYPGWMAQLLLAAIERSLGYLGLNLYTLVIVVLVFVIVWTMLAGSALLRGFVVLLAAATSAIFWSARPQMLTLLLAAITFWVLERESKRRTAALWSLPLIVALWANLHGGFAVGLILLLVYLGVQVIDGVLAGILEGGASWGRAWAERRTAIGRLSLCLVLCLAGACLNPFGPRMIAYPLKTVAVASLRQYVQEWQSPNFHEAGTWPFLAMLLVTFTAFSLSRERRRTVEVVLLLAFGAMALSAARNIALYAVVAAPVLARHGASAIKPLADAVGPGRQVSGGLAAALNAATAALIVVASLLWTIPRIGDAATRQALSDRFPAEAVEYLSRVRPDGPVFNSYNWGGYLIWTLYPEYRTFVDGRTDLFNDEILSEYVTAYAGGSGWDSILDQYGIKLILVERSAPLATLASVAGWRQDFTSEQSVILTR